MKQTLLTLVTLLMACTFYSCTDSKKYNSIWEDPSQPIEKRVNDLVSKMTMEEKITQLVHESKAIKRLNIPEYDWWNECLHGVARNGRATVFPQTIGLAATFDEELIGKISTAISDEARAKFIISSKNNNRGRYTGLTFWTPNINIFRDPRWGRGQETYGEDPFLTSRMAGAFVDGLQGNDHKYLKAAACAKHYAVHSGPEADRHVFDATPTKKDMFNTYLPAFKYLVEEKKVAGVMCAYNRLYGAPCCGSTYLLKDILRNKWNFKGYIVSDCWAVNDFHDNHKVTKSHPESVALALRSGVNVICGDSYPALADALKQGLITKEEIDEAVKQLYTIRFRLGLFDPIEANPYNKISPDVINSNAHQQLAREAGAKSIVMLMNKNNILPLKKDIKKIYLIGPNATNGDVLIGNYYGQSGNLVSILSGITSHVSSGTSVEYKHGILLDRENVNPIDWTTNEAQTYDAIVAVMGISGLLEGEEGDAIASPTKGDRLDINLPINQINYLKKIRSKGNKPIILILTGGSPTIIPDIEKLVDVVLWVGYPGEQGGNAVADVLFGDVNPAGRLPITFPASLDQLPPFSDYSMKDRTYRYMKLSPQFPFGYGLSYSKFSYISIQLKKKNNSIIAEAEVKNISQTDGEEVAQLYIKNPALSNDDPNYSLKGFKRIKIKAGESKKVQFIVSQDMLAFADDEGTMNVSKGVYTFIIGGSSPCQRSLDLGMPQPVGAQIKIE